MRPITLCLFLIVALFAILCTPSNGHYVSAGSLDLSYKQNFEEPVRREKRQLEDFEDEFAPSAKQEEPSFWDRVVKIALQMFGKFVEWLNS